MRKISSTNFYLLKALVPYSQENLRLAFKPSSFFREAAHQHKRAVQTYRSAYYRLINRGLVEIDDHGHPRLTAAGQRAVQPYKPKKLSNGAHLILIFDIPESERIKRNHLRTLLRELSFRKVQQSVWATKYDHREVLTAELKEFGLEKYVLLYEALPVSFE